MHYKEKCENSKDSISVLKVLDAADPMMLFPFSSSNEKILQQLDLCEKSFQVLMFQPKPNGEDSCSLKHLINTGNQQQKTKLAS